MFQSVKVEGVMVFGVAFSFLESKNLAGGGQVLASGSKIPCSGNVSRGSVYSPENASVLDSGRIKDYWFKV